MGDRHQSDTFGLGPDLAKAKKGDREAFEILVNKLRPYLHFLMRNLQHLLGSDMPARMDYSDLVQEGLMRMHNGFPQFRGQTAPQLLAWIGKIAERVLIDVNREVHAGKRNPWMEIHESRALEILSKGSSARRRVERSEDAIELAAALERLSKEDGGKYVRYVQVLELLYFEGLSSEEIGKKMDLQPGTVRVLVLRAKKKLGEDQRLRDAMGAR